MLCNRTSCKKVLPVEVVACVCKELVCCSRQCYMAAYPGHKKGCTGNYSIIFSKLSIHFSPASQQRKQFKPPSKLCPSESILATVDHTSQSETNPTMDSLQLTQPDTTVVRLIANQAPQTSSEINTPQPSTSQSGGLESPSLGQSPLSGVSAPTDGTVPRDKNGKFKTKSAVKKTQERSEEQKTADKISANVSKWKQTAVEAMHKIQNARLVPISCILLTIFLGQR